MTISQAKPRSATQTLTEPHTRFPGGTWQRIEPSADVLKLLDDLDQQAARADVALRTVARSLTANATNPQFFYELGRTLQARQRYDHAAQHYRRAIQIQPEFVAAYVGLASVQRSQGRLDEAVATLRSILEFCPRDSTLHTELTAVLEAQGRVDEIAAHLRRAVARGHLRPDAQRTTYWRDRLRGLGPGLKVGIAWRLGAGAGPLNEYQIELADWDEVLRVPGVQFISLERGDAAAEIAGARERTQPQIHEVLPSARHELDDLAALIVALDLVISLPGTVCHLAGALGANVWVPVAALPPWQEAIAGDACREYPGMRLFRPSDSGRWQEVMAHIAAHLRNAETATCTGK